MKKLSQRHGKPIERIVPDNVLTFDKVTDVFNSGTMHDEDQPVHLHVADTNVCAERCTREYGNPCQYFCPAAVYEPQFEIKSANGQGLGPRMVKGFRGLAPGGTATGRSRT